MNKDLKKIISKLPRETWRSWIWLDNLFTAQEKDIDLVLELVDEIYNNPENYWTRGEIKEYLFDTCIREPGPVMAKMNLDIIKFKRIVRLKIRENQKRPVNWIRLP